MRIQRSSGKPALSCGLLASLVATISLGACGGGGNSPPNPAAVTAVATSSAEAGAAMTAFVPVTATNGTEPYAYSVSPALPAGVSLNSNTGAISGTPSGAQALSSYAITVSDASSLTATSTFSLAITPGVVATTAMASATAVAYTATTPFTPVTASSGTAPYTFSISPALPTGLTLNTGTGAVSGTTTLIAAQAAYTVKVKDAVGASASGTFNLTVNAPQAAPLVTTAAVASSTLIAGPAITPFAPVTATGGFGSLAYAVSPALPTGLSMDATSGIVSGSPTTISAQATYTVTVTDVLASSRSASFALTVNPGPLTATTIAPTESVAANAALTPVVPVVAAGGVAPYTYTVAAGTITNGANTGAAPALATSGLSYDPNTGTLSGTASVTVGSAPYTVTVTDSNGTTSSNTFQLTNLPNGYVLTSFSGLGESLTWMQPGTATVLHAYALGTLCVAPWRLPTEAELLALSSAAAVASGTNSAAAYLKALGWTTTSAYYWASDAGTSGGTFVRVNLSTGTNSSQGATSANYATCVK